MGRRTILLVAALVVAALGTVLVFLYAHNANDRAQADNDPVTVLVAKTTVNAGTTGTAAQTSGAFEAKAIPRSAVAPGALTAVTPIADKVALSTIYSGQQVLTQQFGGTAEASTSTLPIPKGKIAVSIQLGDPARVAGFVEPGSNVAVFSTLSGDATRLLLPTASVIAAGPTTIVSAVTTDDSSQKNSEELPKALLTLAVSQKDAQKLIYASQNGQLYFGLLTGTSQVTAASGVDKANLYR